MDDLRNEHWGTDLAEIQYQLRIWMDYNFPKENSSTRLLGVIEEAGELADYEFHAEPKEPMALSFMLRAVGLGRDAHARLKQLQGIRDGGMLRKGDPTEADGMDAIGDIALCLIGYCIKRGWSFDRILADTWKQVRQRDWVQYPKNGRTE